MTATMTGEAGTPWPPLPRSPETQARMANPDLWAKPFYVRAGGTRFLDGVEWPTGRATVILPLVGEDLSQAPHVQLRGGMEQLPRLMSRLVAGGHRLVWQGEDEQAGMWPVVGQMRRLGIGSDPSHTSGQGIVCDYAVMPGGSVAAHWRTEFPTFERADSFEQYETIHGHGGATAFVHKLAS